jgi:hypothetical protein
MTLFQFSEGDREASHILFMETASGFVKQQAQTLAARAQERRQT